MNRYNILCATDDNYVPFCGIMLTSLFENNKEIKFHVYILTEGLNDMNKKNLATLVNKYQQTINILIINNEILKNCPIKESDHLSIATYYRILAANLIPADIEKILYLDVDIIINNNITNLYNTNIKDCPLAAVIDEGYMDCNKYTRLYISNNYQYFNAGVLLINLDFWRKYNITDKLIKYIIENRERIIQHDQDVLNAVLHEQTKLLPITYNFQTAFLYKITKLDKEIEEELHQCMYNPTVIHYTGIGKPWYYGCKHPYVNKFLYYKSISLWKTEPLIDHRNIKERIRTIIYEIVWRLGLKKRAETYIIKKQA